MVQHNEALRKDSVLLVLCLHIGLLHLLEVHLVVLDG